MERYVLTRWEALDGEVNHTIHVAGSLDATWVTDNILKKRIVLEGSLSMMKSIYKEETTTELMSADTIEKLINYVKTEALICSNS